MNKQIIFILTVLIFIINCGKKQDKTNIASQKEKQEELSTPKQSPLKDIPEETKPVEPIQEKKEIPKQSQKIDKPEKISGKEYSVQELWANYRESREKSKIAFNNSEFHQAIIHLKQTAKYAGLLERDDLKAWQYNNIGYYSTLEFKGLTNYDFRLQKLRTFKKKEARDTYLAETKEIFQKNLKILTDAEIFLEEAYKIDKNYNDKNRTDKIYSNLKFIDWVKNFLEN